MTRKYETEKDIINLVKSFEDASIPREDWKHREHLIVALYYVAHHEVDTAIDKMRSGILNLLANGFKIDLTKEMPYHETITVFWTRTLADFHTASNVNSLVAQAAEIADRFNKDYLLKFYSRELLFSDEARARFIKGDLDNGSSQN